MNQKLLTYTGIIAVVVSLPTLLQQADMTTGSIVCLVGLVLTFYLYKRYTDEQEDKTLNTVGQGVKFGVVAGVFIMFLSLINTFLLLDPEAYRATQIEALQPFADMMGEQAYEMRLQEIEGMTADDITNAQLMFAWVPILVGAFLGLIAGLIFKHREEEI